LHLHLCDPFELHALLTLERAQPPVQMQHLCA
jgi:hypothetical protein